MPKEYVNCEDYGREVELADSDGHREKLPKVAASIMWSKDIGNVGVRIVDREVDPDGLEGGVRTLYLDRQGINRMIRLLRKARDDSFGRDE